MILYALLAGNILTLILVNCFGEAAQKKKLRRIADRDKLEDDEVSAKFQKQMTEFKQRHPEAEDQYDEATAVEVENMRKKHARELEEIDDRRMTRDQGIRLMAGSKFDYLGCYIFWWLWLLFLVVSQASSSLDVFMTGIGVSIFCTLTCLMYYLSIGGDDFAFFDNMIPMQAAKTDIEFIRDCQPLVFIEALCPGWTSVYGANPKSESNGDLYSINLATPKYREEFRYSCWKNSPELKFPDFHRTGIIIVDVDLRIIFGDEETQDAFKRQYARFQEEHHRKKYHENCLFVVRSEIPARFLKHFYVVSDLNAKPWWFKSSWYRLASLLLLTWPYRYLLSRTASRKKYSLVKSVYHNSPPDHLETPRFHKYVDSSIDTPPHITCNGACVREPSIPESTESPPSSSMVTEGTNSSSDGIAIIGRTDDDHV